MNHLQEAKKAMSAYEAKKLNIDTLKAQAHALIAIAEELEKANTQYNVFGNCLISELPRIAEQLEIANKFSEHWLRADNEYVASYLEDCPCGICEAVRQEEK